MKRLFILSLLIIYSVLLTAQSGDKRFAIGLHGGAIQYFGDLTDSWYDFSDPWYGAASFSFNVFLNKHWDAGLLSTYSQSGYFLNHKDYFHVEMISNNLNVRYKFLTNDFPLNPFLFVGAGNIVYTQKFTLAENKMATTIFSGGGGILLQVTPVLHLQWTESFCYTDYDKTDNNHSNHFSDWYLYHMAGVVFYFGNSKDSDNDGVKDKRDHCLNTEAGVAVDRHGCPPDSDGDGLPDYADKCPHDKGVPSAQGCPDSDGDGVADSEDACPTIPGKKEMAGCPDRDNDGVKDADDECPDVYGIKIFKGCPDSDGDGIQDKDDLCPTKIGTVENKGCPYPPPIDSINKKVETALVVVPVKSTTTLLSEKALHGLEFETSNQVLKHSSFKILDEVAEYLSKNPKSKLHISTNTDAVGDSLVNQVTSDLQASEVKKYLVKKGIESKRITAKGYGKSKPVATNKTPEGRAANKRVELEFVE